MTKKDNDILDYIDLEDYTLEPLEESKEFKEWKKKDNNMTEELTFFFIVLISSYYYTFL